MKFGVGLPNSGPFATAAAIRTVGLECERLGYDSVWVHDHVSWTAADAEHHFWAGSLEAWRPPIVPNVYEAMTTLTYVAAITSRIGLGTSVVVPVLRNPVWLAKEAACLDQLSGGRLILGVGLGGDLYASAELGALGALHLRRARGKVVDEWVEVIRGVWREPRFSFKGDFIEVADAEVFPKPFRQPGPPLWWGGLKESAWRRVGAWGDGWMSTHLLPAEIEDGRRRIAERAVAAGRDPAGIAVASQHWLCIGRDGARAEAFAERTIAGLARHVAALRGSDRSSERLGGANRNLVGDPETILRRLAEYRAAGVGHIVVRVISRDLSEMLEELDMFKREVIDRLDG